MATEMHLTHLLGSWKQLSHCPCVLWNTQQFPIALQLPSSLNLLLARPELQGSHRCRGQKVACEATLAASWALVDPPPPLLLPCWLQIVGQQPLQPVLAPCPLAWTALRRSPRAGLGLLELRSWAPAHRGRCFSAEPTQQARVCPLEHAETTHVGCLQRLCCPSFTHSMCCCPAHHIREAAAARPGTFPDAVHMHGLCHASPARPIGRAVHCHFVWGCSLT